MVQSLQNVTCAAVKSRSPPLGRLLTLCYTASHAQVARMYDSKIWNHADSKAYSFKTTDEAESKKRNEDVQSHERFKV